jgi:hypothetical protein
MSNSIPALDQVIQETVHRSGGVELLGDPLAALAGKCGPVCELFDVSEEGQALLDPEATVEQQLAVWRQANLVADARRLLSHALPPRHSLWWALLTLTEAHRQKAYPPKVVSAILAARDFVLNPTEAGRRLCHELAEAADSTTAGGVIGYAAFLSGGSMAPPECPPVLPMVHLCGRLCGVSVYLAAVHFNPACYKEHLQHFLDIGLQVARGELAWPDAAQRAQAALAAEPEKLVETVVEQVIVERAR